jgi:hypothetical protein
MIKKLWAFGVLFLLLITIIPISIPSEDPPGWSDDTRLTAVEDHSSLKPRIAVDSQNNTHIVYNDYRHGPPELHYIKLDPEGNVLVDEKQVTLADTMSTNLGDIACDSQDNIHVVWSDVRDTGQPVSNLEIYYKKLDNNGNNLVDDTRITVAPYYSVYPAIAVDPSDNIHIAWCEEMEFGSIWQEEVFYTKLDNNGNTLVDDIAVTESDGEESLFPDIAVDSQGNVHIMWIDDRNETGTQQNQDYWYSKLDNDGNTIVDDTMIFFKGEHFRPSISIDSNDLLHVICGSFQGWKGNTYRQIYRVLLDNDGNIQNPEMRLTNDEGNASHPRATFDSQEDLHIVWEDERHNNTEIYYVKLDIGGNVLIDELRLTDNMSKSLTPQIAIDSTDTINVVWADGRDYEDGDRVELYHKQKQGTIPNVPPTVGITTPSEGETLSGEILISGWASDSDGTVERVEVMIESGFWLYIFQSSSWDLLWDTTSESDGPYTVYARSFDGTDYSEVQSVTVFVNNTEAPPAPNVPPSVSITPPQQYQVAGDVQIQGTASDSDGSVKKVQLKIDSGGWRTAANTISWSYIWDTTEVADGEHSIYARAEDDSGEFSELDSITLSVNNTQNSAPFVSIIYPTEGVVSGLIEIFGSTSDVDGKETITLVQVRIGNLWESATGTSSWSYIWDTNVLEDGDYEISVRAFDGELHSQVESVTVSVDNPYPPTLTLFTDVPETVSGTLDLRGTASDEDGDIDRIEILIDSGEWELITTSNDWAYELDTVDLSNGLHTITIRATDDEGDFDLIILGIFVENEEEELPMEMYLLLIILIVVVIILIAAGSMRRSKSKKMVTSNELGAQGLVFETLKCPVCSNVFQADSSLPVQCPNCGYNGGS